MHSLIIRDEQPALNTLILIHFSPTDKTYQEKKKEDDRLFSP